jgi:hypothetical protein
VSAKAPVLTRITIPTTKDIFFISASWKITIKAQRADTRAYMDSCQFSGFCQVRKFVLLKIALCMRMRDTLVIRQRQSIAR